MRTASSTSSRRKHWRDKQQLEQERREMLHALDEVETSDWLTER